MPQKVIINRCYGGFGLSQKAYERLIELGIPVVSYDAPRPSGSKRTKKEEDKVCIYDDQLSHKHKRMFNRVENRRYWETWSHSHRDHPLLIQVVEELGKDANGDYADLRIVSVPDGVQWVIDEYDGVETVEEAYRSWS